MIAKHHRHRPMGKLTLFSTRLSRDITQQSAWFHGVMVSTLDSESSDPSSNLGGTWFQDCHLSTCLSNPPSPDGVSGWESATDIKTAQSLSDRRLITRSSDRPLLLRDLWGDFTGSCELWFHGVMVSTLDFESSDPSSNLGGTWFREDLHLKCSDFWKCESSALFLEDAVFFESFVVTVLTVGYLCYTWQQNAMVIG